MKYISIDIETTGLDPNYCQMLEFAAILEDTNKKLPREECPSLNLIFDHKQVYGEPYALNMNSRIIKILAEQPRPSDDSEAWRAYRKENNIISPKDLIYRLRKFLWIHYEGNDPASFEYDKAKKIYINVAGKNFAGFDNKFLSKDSMWGVKVKPRSRIIDPTTPFIDWKNDDQPPGLEKCKERAGIAEDKISHVALDDAWDVIEVLRDLY